MDGLKRTYEQRGETACCSERHSVGKGLGKVNDCANKACLALMGLAGRFKRKLCENKGQGTTEYAILVGVLVVIAIIAVVAFRDKLQSLWESISNGINSL